MDRCVCRSFIQTCLVATLAGCGNATVGVLLGSSGSGSSSGQMGTSSSQAAETCGPTAACTPTGTVCLATACVDGVCVRTPVVARFRCADHSGNVCDGEGHCVGCLQEADCVAPEPECGSVVCTNRTCDFTFHPQDVPLPVQTPADCHTAMCDGMGHRRDVVDDSDKGELDVTGIPCRVRVCEEGALETVFATGVCPQDATKVCEVRPTGPTGQCVDCNEAADCGGHAACSSHVCQPPSCSDTATNGEETDVDCGGPSCPPCVVGRTCLEGRDCDSARCDGVTHLCLAGTCMDLLKNGDERAVDCGGTCATQFQQGCANETSCLVAGDCTSGLCINGTCSPPSCSDQMLNGGETGVDCGGPCAPAQRCATGLLCQVDGDCQSNLCPSGMCRACGGQWACPSGTHCEGENCVPL